MTEFKITYTEKEKKASCTVTGNDIDLVKVLIEIMHADERIRSIIYCAVTTQAIEAKVDMNDLMDIAKKHWYRKDHPSN